MKYKDKVDIINEICESSSLEDCYVHLLDGFENALVGYDITNGEIPTPLYDGNKMVDILVKRDCMTIEQATEYIDHNVIGSLKKDDLHYPRIITILRNKKNG